MVIEIENIAFDIQICTSFDFDGPVISLNVDQFFNCGNVFAIGAFDTHCTSELLELHFDAAQFFVLHILENKRITNC